jgi:hypothetical protein
MGRRRDVHNAVRPGRPTAQDATDPPGHGISYKELMQVPELIAVTGGIGKAAALRSGRAVTSVVTDFDAARTVRG